MKIRHTKRQNSFYCPSFSSFISQKCQQLQTFDTGRGLVVLPAHSLSKWRLFFDDSIQKNEGLLFRIRQGWTMRILEPHFTFYIPTDLLSMLCAKKNSRTNCSNSFLFWPCVSKSCIYLRKNDAFLLKKTGK